MPAQLRRIRRSESSKLGVGGLPGCRFRRTRACNVVPDGIQDGRAHSTLSGARSHSARQEMATGKSARPGRGGSVSGVFHRPGPGPFSSRPSGEGRSGTSNKCPMGSGRPAAQTGCGRAGRSRSASKVIPRPGVWRPASGPGKAIFGVDLVHVPGLLTLPVAGGTVMRKLQSLGPRS